MTQLTYFESPKNWLSCTVVDPLGCHFVLYKVGWKLWSWLTSRRESFSTLTLTYMHSITELSHWKKTSSWIEKSDPDQGKSLTSWLFRCQKDQNFLTRSYVSRCSLGGRVSPVEHTKVYYSITELSRWKNLFLDREKWSRSRKKPDILVVPLSKGSEFPYKELCKQMLLG